MTKKVDKIKQGIEQFKNENGISGTGEKSKTEEKKDFLKELQEEYGELEISGEINGSNLISFRTNLTGKELQLCKATYEKIKKSKAKTLAELDDIYYLIVAERMTDIPHKEFTDLHVIDMNSVIKHVRNFLGE